MNKFKKFLSLSVLGAAALSMTAGACFLINPAKVNIAADAEVTSETVANEIPSYVKTDGMTQNSTYFTKDLPLVFNAEVIRSSTGETPTSMYGYYPDKANDPNHYYLFSDIAVTVKLNGKTITGVDSNNFVVTSSMAIKGQADVHPEVLAIKIKRGAEFNQTQAEYKQDENKFNPGELTLTESGLLEITVSYGLYDTHFIANKDYDATANAEAFTETIEYSSKEFTYTAFLFENDDYFAPACQNEPDITYSANLERQASYSTATHKWEYFYNYATAELPHITYNANHVRLTITKNYNNNTESATLAYDPNTQTITKPSFVKDVVVSDHNVTVYFNDVGVYNMHYDMIYNYLPQTDSGEPASSYRSFEIYQPINLEIDGKGSTTTVLDQKVHILGAQISYTDYTNNQFKEFKKFNDDNHTISKFGETEFFKSADVSYLLNSTAFASWKAEEGNSDKSLKDYLLKKNITPVSTNQTPLKLTTNLSTASGTFNLYKLNGTNWDSGTNFSLTKNLSEPGTYLLTLEGYGYAGYTAANKTYNQVFYFTINKTTPDVSITAVSGDSETTLFSGDYTNKKVKIKYSEFQNDFDAPVRFELVRKDFTTGTTLAPQTITFNASGEYEVTADGKYTLNIYYGKQSLALTPITKKFIIDTQDISGLTAYAVETSGINSDFRKTINFEGSTNQPFVFTWDNEKKSGAVTYGYYKYFPLTSTNYYPSTDLEINTLVANLISNNILATDNELTINGSSAWINYSNPAHLVKNNNSIESRYVNENAGLYIFEIFDQAGNSAVSIVMYDDSKPYFVLDTSSTGAGGYKLITSNYTLTTDAKVIWSENKAIKTVYNSADLSAICTNKNGEQDNKLEAAFNSFLEDKIVNYTNLTGEKNGNYYLVPINSEIAYRDRSTENYTIEEMKEKEIQFSYTIHYTENGGTTTYYISTSNPDIYLTMDTHTSAVASKTGSTITINGNILNTADIYRVNGDNGYEYYYGKSGSLNWISLGGISATATLEDGICKVGGKAASKAPFIDMEGTYVFLIRDASNTQGANLEDSQKYLRYASNYQYIKVLSDTSQMTVYYKENDSQEVTLSDASFAKIENIEEGGTASDKNRKASFFNPTSVEKTLYVSFIPTVGKEGSSSQTQVEKITLAYYPYETKSITKTDPDGNIYIAFYRTLSATPLFENEVYNFTTDGASESKIEKSINVDKNITAAGRYILTRTYMTGENYIIDVFDYFERSLTTLVDRYGVLTSPETITIDVVTKTYSVNGFTATVQKYGNVVIVSGASSLLNDANCSISDANATLISCYTQNDKIYFVFASEVDDGFTLNSAGYEISIQDTSTAPIAPSLESIVGGDIFINMYDGENGEGVVSVAFPYYKEDGLNSGNSFYTSPSTNWSDTASVGTSLKTNKLPVKLYIPEVKYTIANEELYVDAESDERYFSNILNDTLTYFDTDANFKSTSAITPYQLVASVEFMPAGETTTTTYTSKTGKNGFLAFVDKNGDEIDTFYKAGVYTVTITQGYYTDSNASNNFRKNYKFGFVIESSAPEFNLSASGKELNTLDNSNYYTNEKTATISWEEDTDDRYIAKIDKAKISIQITKSQSVSSEIIAIDADGAISSNLYGSTTPAALSFTQSGKMNYLTVNLNMLGIYNNNDKFTITMQFEGHNERYYTTTTKTIIVDKTASNETLSGLIGKLLPLSNATIPLSDTTLRNYYNIDGSIVESADEATFNVSKNVGYLKYYTYQVNDDFFVALKSLANINSTSGANYRGGTVAVYYRALEDGPYEGEFTETAYDNFTASNYNDLSDGIPFDTSAKYYEIVEQDLAGNLSIYLVHKYVISSDAEDAQGLAFKDGTSDVKQICDQQILSNMLNIYSSTNFTISSLNFMGDKWLELNIDGSLFMLSPWLENGQAYRLAGANAEIVSLNSIFAAFKSSPTPIPISISNSADGTFALFNLTLLDGAQLNTYLSESNSEEYISISYSTSVFPVKVIIYDGAQIYNCENDPNALGNLVSGYSYVASWASNDKISATADQTLSLLNFAFTTLPNPNSKIKYEIIDNFGNVTKIVHVYGQSLYNEVESSGSLYKNLVNDETTNHEAELYYISPVDLRFSYNDTVHTVKVFKWENNDWKAIDNGSNEYNYSKVNLTTLTFANVNGKFINNKYKIEVYEYDIDAPLDIDESKYVKTIYFHIYSTLPQMDETATSFFKLSDNYGENITAAALTDVSLQRVTVNGRIYTVTRGGSTFASTVTFTYTNSESFDYPFSVYYYKVGGEGSGFTQFNSGSTFSESGVYYFLVSYDNTLTNEYALYKLEILDSATEFYRITNNGKQVEKAGSYYYYKGTEYSEYYIVNVNYNTSASLIQIIPNNYQNITVANTAIKVAEGEGVFTIGYRVFNYTEGEPIKPGTSPFDRMVFITYIPSTTQPVSEAYFTFNSADQIDMLTSSTIIAAADKNDPALSSLKLIFSHSYGIANNLIQITVLKDGVPYPIEIKTEEISSEGGSSKTLRYVELSTSGTYTISLSDIAGNRQIFAAGTSQASQTLKLIFLKDVAFTMTYTDANGNECTTDPIQKGVFNRKVALTLLNANEYYTAQSVGSGQSMITATRNGLPFTDFGFDAETKTFTFNKPGYYSIFFSATSTTGVEIREEVYNFTIVNPEESRYSFEYAPYDGYYIKSISKDNVGDITRNADGSIKQEFKNIYQTVVIGNKEYLKHITTSFLDSLTGIGRYTITISTSKSLNRTDYTAETEFSFNYWVNTKSVPLSVSITEGEATSKDISVSFNAERVFESVGECVITIGANQYEINSASVAALGVVNDTISTTGTYFITVRSTSGNLLYSYKVIKNEPLNTWAIIAICIGGVAAIAVVIIIVKLRKKINIK